MKYAVIITYSGGESAGAVVTADGREDAWMQIVEIFGGAGKDICSIQMAEFIASETLDEGEEVKVIIKSGIVTEVLSNGNPQVEIVDIDPDYDDYEPLERYEDSLYKRPDLEEKDFTVARFN